MKKKIKILCTLGPSTINKSFLKFAKKKISLLRLNMSHTSLKRLIKNILFIKKYSKIPLCIDTEGAQIRIQTKKTRIFKKNQIFKIYKNKKLINFYPPETFKKLKIKDILNFGFDGLIAEIIKKNQNLIILKVYSPGKLENNKGVHLQNRSLKLNFLTDKDFEAIKIGKKYNIKNFALSFTNSINDIHKFNNILPTENKIFKIESKAAIKNIKNILKKGSNFLIDRGDLSKEIKIENIPVIQRHILKIANKYKNKNIYIATNFLESMIQNKYPTRGEANDIYNSLETGAAGLVLAAETAIGKNPYDAINFLIKMIKIFEKQKK